MLIIDDIRLIRSGGLFTIQEGMRAYDVQQSRIRFYDYGTQNQRAYTYAPSTNFGHSKVVVVKKDVVNKAVKELMRVRTPSGQDQYRCDISIRPKSFSCSYGKPVGNECILKGDIRSEDREIIKLLNYP